MSAARALFAAPAARRALAGRRGGAVEVALRRGAYVSLGDGWLALADPSAPFGPLSLVVQGLERLDLPPGSPVHVIGSRLVVGEHEILLERMRERRTAPLSPGPPARASAIGTAAAAALAALPDPPALLRRGIAALAAGRVREAVHSLAGLGEGLTPAGDDVLAGYAAARAALGPSGPPQSASPDGARTVSRLAARRSSALGLAYLRCAERGEMPDAGARLLIAICSGSVPAVRSALPPLRAWGASSGTALAWGMAAGVEDSTARGALTCRARQGEEPSNAEPIGKR